MAKWEARLASEGMPADFPMSRRQAGIEPYEDSASLADSPLFQYWTNLSHAVHALPTRYRNRAFLIEFAERGCYMEACTEYGYTREKGRTIIRNFVKYMKVQNGT